MNEEPRCGDLASAWKLLYSHPALAWTPPLLRGAAGSASVSPTSPVVRAIERNLLVNINRDSEGICYVMLSTGPLEDRLLGDGVDPVAPTARRDERLDVRAPTFEAAVCELAARVVDVYGPCSAQEGSGQANAGDASPPPVAIP
jgi:hypothetical protein